MVDLLVGPLVWLGIRELSSFGHDLAQLADEWRGSTMDRIDNGEGRGGNTTRQLAMHGGRDGWMVSVGVTFVRDHEHAHGSRRSELTNCLGENPGGTLGTAHANPCCWLTPIGP